MPPAKAVAACTKSFDGEVEGDISWSNGLNWSPNGAPGETDVVCIGRGFNVSLRSNSHVAAFAIDGHLSISQGADLTVDSDSEAASLSTDWATITGAGNITIPTGGAWSLAFTTLSGTGDLTVEPGAFLSFDRDINNVVREVVVRRDLINRGTVRQRTEVELFATSTSGFAITNEGTWSVDVSDVSLDLGASGPIASTFVSTAATAAVTVQNATQAARTFTLRPVSTVDGLVVSGPTTARLTGAGNELRGPDTDIGEGSTLELAGSTTVTGTVRGSGALVVSGGTTVLPVGSAMTLPTITVRGSTLDTAIDLAPLSLNMPGNTSGTITGAGNLTVPAGFTWNIAFSTVSGTGDLTVEPGAAVNLNRDINNVVRNVTIRRDLVNRGTVRQRTDVSVTTTSTSVPGIVNEGTWAADLADVSMTLGWTGTTAPSFTSTAATSSVTVQNPSQTARTFTLSLTATIDGFAVSGPATARLTGAGKELRGLDTEIGQGSTLELSGNTTVTGTVRGSGALLVSGGTTVLPVGSAMTLPSVTVRGSTLDTAIDLAPPTLNMPGNTSGTITGSGNLTAPAGSSWNIAFSTVSGTGDLIVEPGGALNFNRDINNVVRDVTLRRDLLNRGLVRQRTSVNLTSTASLVPGIQNDGTWEADVSSAAFNLGTVGPTATTFTNRGQVSKTGGLILTVSTRLTNEGSIAVAAGRINQTGAVTNLANGVLTGGVWDVSAGAILRLPSAVTTNSADIRLGGAASQLLDAGNLDGLRNLAKNTNALRLAAGASVTTSAALRNEGTVVLSAASTLRSSSGFTQTSTGRLDVTLAGTAAGVSHSVVIAGGAAQLDGVLALHTDPSFRPTEGGLRIVDAASVSGRFSKTEGRGIGNGGVWSPTYDDSGGDVVLTVTAPSADCGVLWSGEGGDGRFGNGLNWATGQVPGATDSACIPDGAGEVVADTDITVGSLRQSGDDALKLVGGTFEVVSSATVDTLLLDGATLTGAGDITVARDFTWLSGPIEGAGLLRSTTYTGFGSDTGALRLNRRLTTVGFATWIAGDMELGAEWRNEGSVLIEQGMTNNSDPMTMRPLAGGQGRLVSTGTFHVSSTTSSFMHILVDYDIANLRVSGSVLPTTEPMFLVMGSGAVGEVHVNPGAELFLPREQSTATVRGDITVDGGMNVSGRLITSPGTDIVGTGALGVFGVVELVSASRIGLRAIVMGDGTIVLHLAGAGAVEYPTIDTDVARLGGTLEVSTDYAALDGQEITFLTADDLTERFDRVVSVGDPGFSWEAAYAPTHVTLTARAPEIGVSVGDISVDEGAGSASVPVTLSADAPAPITLEFGVSNLTASEGDDYAAPATALVIPTGGRTGTVPVTIHQDDADEPNETFRISVTSADGSRRSRPIAARAGTVTIVDDDAVSNDQTGEAIAAATGGLLDEMPRWAENFDFAELDLPALGLPDVSLPVVSSDLDGLFGIAGRIGNLSNPLEGIRGPLDESTLAAIEGRGCIIDFVADAIGGRPRAQGDDKLQVRCPVDGGALTAQNAGAAAYGDGTPGVLAGLGAGPDIDAEDFDLDGDLGLSLVVGIDADGAYVASVSGIGFGVNGGGSVSGDASIGGVSASVRGEGTAALDITLQPVGSAPQRVRAGTANALESQLAPVVTGNADLNLDFDVAGTKFAWATDWRAATDGAGAVTFPDTPRLAGTLTVPGLVDMAGNAFALDLTSQRTPGGPWSLTFAQPSGQQLKLGGFPLSSLALGATLSSVDFGGTGSATLAVQPISPAVAMGFTLARDRLGLSGSARVATIDVGPARLSDVLLDVIMSAPLPGGLLSVGASVHAASVSLFPGGQAASATASNVFGSVDASGNVSFSGATVALTVAGAISCTAPEVSFAVGPNATGPLFEVDGDTICRFDPIDNVNVKVTDLRLERAGRVSASAASAQLSGLLSRIPIAGLFPYRPTSLELRWPSLSDLAAFTVHVGGVFEFGPLANLPFTPRLGIGNRVATPSSSEADRTFNFSLKVDGSGVRPFDLGPITLGFDDLELGPITIGGDVTLGQYRSGDFVGPHGFAARIESGLDAIGEVGVSATGGDVRFDSQGAHLDFGAAFTLSGRIGSVELEDARIAFDVGVDVGPGFSFGLRGPTVHGVGFQRLRILAADLFVFNAVDCTLTFDPGPDDRFLACGEDGLTIEFLVDPFKEWGGGVDDLTLDRDFRPVPLPGFGVELDPGTIGGIGLPKWLPFSIDRIELDFPNVREGQPFNPSGALVTVDGGINLIMVGDKPLPGFTAGVTGLEIDLQKMADCGAELLTDPSSCQSPFTNLDGVRFGVTGVELPGMTVGGIVDLGSVRIPVTRSNGTREETVFYARINGTVEMEGIGAGIDLVLTEVGPLIAEVKAPLGIPLGPTGFLLAGVSGAVQFGVEPLPEPDPSNPTALLEAATFQELGDTEIDRERIEERLTRIFATAGGAAPTWSTGALWTGTATFTHVAAPIIQGEVTYGMNLGVRGDVDVDLLTKGDIEVMGIPVGVAGMHIALGDPLNPALTYAVALPPPGSLAEIIAPVQAEAGVVVRTDGMAEGTARALYRFVTGLANDSGELVDDLLDQLADDVQADLQRNGAQASVLTQHLLRNGVPPADGVALRQRLTEAMATNGATLVQPLLVGLTEAAGRLVARVAETRHEAEQMASQLAEEVFGRIVEIVRSNTQGALDEFLSVADPRFTIQGSLVPSLLGIPLGEPNDIVGLSIAKTGIEFQLSTSISGWMQRIGTAWAGPLAIYAGQLKTDQVTIIAELPLTGLLRAAIADPTAAPPKLGPGERAGSEWGVTIDGTVGWLGMDLVKLSGLLVPPGNGRFVEDHTQRLYLDCAGGAACRPYDGNLRERPIALRSASQFDTLVTNGGLVLATRLMAPEMLTDPKAVLERVDFDPPDDPAQLLEELEELMATLTNEVSPGYAQLYVPPLARAQDAYFEGSWDAKLLSIPLAKGSFRLNATGARVEGTWPLLGLNVAGEITAPTEGGLPRAGLDISVDSARVRLALAGLGVPTPLLPASNAGSGRFRAFTPGFDPSATLPDSDVADIVKRHGGLELEGRFRLPSVLGGGTHQSRFAMAGNGDFSATASVSDFAMGPVSIEDASVSLLRTTPSGGTREFSFEVHASGTLFGGAVNVDGTLTTAPSGSLGITLGDPDQPISVGGFELSGSFALEMGAAPSVTFNGELRLPSWLASSVGVESIAASGRISSDGGFDFALSIASYRFHQDTVITPRTGADILRVKRSSSGVVTLAINGSVGIPGTSALLTVSGTLDSNGLGSLTISMPNAVRFGATPFKVKGTFTLSRLVENGQTVARFRATNALFDWENVGSVTVAEFVVGTDGVAAVSLPNADFILGGGAVLHMGSTSFRMDAGALAARLHIAHWTLKIPGLQGPNAGAFLLPDVDLSVGDFTYVINADDFDLGALDFTGKLKVAKRGAVFSLGVGPDGNEPPRVAFGPVSLRLPEFTIATDGTFDVHATDTTLVGFPLLGLTAGDLRLRSFFSTENLQSERIFRLTVTDPLLHLPIGAPAPLPDFDFDSSGVFDRVLGPISLNLGPVFSFDSGRYHLRLSATQLGLELVEASDNRPHVSALGGSDITLREFAVSSGGRFEGEVRGTLKVFGREIANAAYKLSRTEAGTIIAEMDGQTTINLGWIRVNSSGTAKFRSTGSFEFHGSAGVFFPQNSDCRPGSPTFHGFAAGGSVSVDISSSDGIAGTFSGCIKIPFGSANVSGSLSYRGRIAGQLVIRNGDGDVTYDKAFKLWLGTGTLRTYNSGDDIDYETDFLANDNFAFEDPDNSAPSFTPSPPLDQTVSVDFPAGSNDTGVVYDLPEAEDDILDPSQIGMFCSPAPGTRFTVGAHTIQCKASDRAGHEKTASFTLTVERAGSSGPVAYIEPGSEMTTSGSGFRSGSTTNTEIHSEPRLLGHATADANGNVVAKFTIPPDMEPGEHHILIVGRAPNGTKRVAVRSITITGPGVAGAPVPVGSVAASTPNELPVQQRPLGRTGGDVETLFAVAVALLTLGELLRRQAKRVR